MRRVHAFRSRFCQTAHLEAEPDILQNIHMWKQGIVLEHHTETAVFRFLLIDATVVDINTAARRA